MKRALDAEEEPGGIVVRRLHRDVDTAGLRRMLGTKRDPRPARREVVERSRLFAVAVAQLSAREAEEFPERDDAEEAHLLRELPAGEARERHALRLRALDVFARQNVRSRADACDGERAERMP